MGYSFRLTARVLLYAPSHRQNSTYNRLCYTSRGALAGTRNSSMGPPSIIKTSLVYAMTCPKRDCIWTRKYVIPVPVMQLHSKPIKRRDLQCVSPPPPYLGDDVGDFGQLTESRDTFNGNRGSVTLIFGNKRRKRTRGKKPCAPRAVKGAGTKTDSS